MENHTGAECNLLCFVRLKREWTIGGLALLKEGWHRSHEFTSVNPGLMFFLYTSYDG